MGHNAFQRVLIFYLIIKKIVMNFFKNKNNSSREIEKHSTRRNFVYKTLAALAGISLIPKIPDVLAKDKETGFMYIKPNGEKIYNYQPQGTDPYLGEICIFGFIYVPQGWNLCDGSILNISQNPDLFNLIGAAYGGDGVNNFALPDFTGSLPVGAGAGPGLTARTIGQSGGSNQVTLAVNQMPIHNHILRCSLYQGSYSSPQGNFIAASGDTNFSTQSDCSLSDNAISAAGSSYPVNITQPNLTLNICIATSGVTPMHN